MKNISINDFIIHNYQANINGYQIYPNIQGLESPEMRLANNPRPGEYGAFLSNQLYGGRLITMEGAIIGTSPSDHELKRRALINATKITKDDYSVPVPLSLKLTTMDDLELQVEVYRSAIKMARTHPTYSKFLLEFYSDSYVIESQDTNTISMSALLSGGVIYAVTYPAVYGASSGGTKIITNNGDAEVFPVITLTGPLNDPILNNSTIGKYMALDMIISATDQVVIDMKNKTILYNGTPYLSAKTLGSEWWWLVSGVNTIYLNTGDSNDTGAVTIEYRHAYSGI